MDMKLVNICYNMHTGQNIYQNTGNFRGKTIKHGKWKNCKRVRKVVSQTRHGFGELIRSWYFQKYSF